MTALGQEQPLSILAAQRLASANSSLYLARNNSKFSAGGHPIGSIVGTAPAESIDRRK